MSSVELGFVGICKYLAVIICHFNALQCPNMQAVTTSVRCMSLAKASE